MYCRAIAVDFDGTGASDGHLSLEVAAALGKARAQGYTTLLVTGRLLEDILPCNDGAIFDAIVAENGARISFCGLDREIQLGTPPPDRFLGELRAHGVSFHSGAVIVGTWDRYTHEVLDLIRRFGIDGQLIFNRGATMLLPSGINKAVGVRRALEELGRSEHNLIAFGDAENDLPLLAMAEVGIAAGGSVPMITAAADDRLSQSGGGGVAHYVHRLLEQGGIVPTPARHSFALGRLTGDNAPASMPASGVNVIISGDPRSGKSWIAGLMAEKLLEQGYRLCIVDPEGDYLSIGHRSKILTFGRDLPLPSPETVSRLFSVEPLSFVLDLSSVPLKEQTTYVSSVLQALESSRAATGIPHWLLIDEAHYFFDDQGSCSRYLESPTGNFILVTYRPSLLSGNVYTRAGAHVITCTTVEDERYFITKLLQARGPRDLVCHEAMADPDLPVAGLLLAHAESPSWQVFTPARRLTMHAHHARKYADTRLPDDRAFRFLGTEGPEPVLAHNIIEFHQAVRIIPRASLVHHLNAGDFSRWADNVLGDKQLANGLRKLEQNTASRGTAPSREEILAHLEDHYLIKKPENPTMFVS